MTSGDVDVEEELLGEVRSTQRLCGGHREWKARCREICSSSCVQPSFCSCWFRPADRRSVCTSSENKLFTSAELISCNPIRSGQVRSNTWEKEGNGVG